MALSVPPSLELVLRARQRLGDLLPRTPLIPLDGQDDPPRLFLKLENLQPTGSFKVRGAGNSVLAAMERGVVRGVYTTSAGNMAQALAWHARRLGLPCTTIVPETAPAAKLEGIRRFGAHIVQLPWEEVWSIGARGSYAPLGGNLYIPPFNHPDMIAGNGTIGVEIAEQLPGVERVYVPFGGGGLVAGIASALKTLRPSASVVACEPDTAAPFAASLRNGVASRVDRQPSFVDGIGAENVFPEMWERLHGLVRESRTPSLAEIAAAVRFLFERHHVVAEGAAGASVAAAQRDPEAGASVRVAVVSGGNIDPGKLMTILSGAVP
jgi:threonine dehydratase